MPRRSSGTRNVARSLTTAMSAIMAIRRPAAWQMPLTAAITGRPAVADGQEREDVVADRGRARTRPARTGRPGRRRSEDVAGAGDDERGQVRVACSRGARRASGRSTWPASGRSAPPGGRSCTRRSAPLARGAASACPRSSTHRDLRPGRHPACRAFVVLATIFATLQFSNDVTRVSGQPDVAAPVTRSAPWPVPGLPAPLHLRSARMLDVDTGELVTPGDAARRRRAHRRGGADLGARTTPSSSTSATSPCCPGSWTWRSTCCSAGPTTRSPLNAVQDDPALRTLRAVANARRTLRAGFTTVRNLGLFVQTGGLLLDVALMKAIDFGWIDGPRVVPGRSRHHARPAGTSTRRCSRRSRRTSCR